MNGDFWQTVKMLASELGCPPIRKQCFHCSGYRDVADPRLERVTDHGSGLMVLDSDRRLGPGTVTGPLDMAGNHIFRALEPLKTNDRDCAARDFAALQYNRVRTYRPVLSLLQAWFDARPAKLCDREAQSCTRFAILDPSVRA